jgi:serine phosphatase RsbU (regulator of sigma subunit)
LAQRAAQELARVSDRERAIVGTLQHTLVPSLPEGVPGLDVASFYRAALEEANIGGDFSDVFPVEKACYVLVVGDLSGKGLAAAAQVSTVRNMLRYAVYTAPTIAQAIRGLNRILVLNRLLDGFATLVVATFDFNARTLTYVSCGQEPALLRRRADGAVEELGPTGPILGAVENARYEEREIPLSAGDTFVLYTDGITESGPDRRHLLGVTGLTGLLKQGGDRAATLVEQIVAGVDLHAQGRILDDMCLLVGVVRPDATVGSAKALDPHHPSQNHSLQETRTNPAA